MTILDMLVDRIFDLLFGPLRPLPLVVSLSVVSLVTAIAILMIVRATSNQRALAAVKRQIHRDLFEIRLFNDDLRAMARAQADILRHNAIYLRLSLVPMLWTLIPLGLLVAQLQCYFGYSGVSVGQPVLVTAQLKSREAAPAGAVVQTSDAAENRPVTTLDVPLGIRIDTPAIWFQVPRQVVWRVVADMPGDYAVRLGIGGETYVKTLQVSEGLSRRSPVRPERGLTNQLLYPSEPPLPESAPLASISVAYPERRLDLLGTEVHWMSAYLVLSLILALLLKGPLRVTL